MPVYHVKKFLYDAFPGKARLSGDGKEINLPCPFHEDRHAKKHFYLNLKTGMWICFRCDERGSFVRLVRTITNENPELRFSDYVIFEPGEEADDAGLLRPYRPLVPKEKGSCLLPEGYLPVWMPVVGYEAMRAQALAYLGSRGVDFVTARLYEIGYAPTGRLGKRVIVPVRAADARLVGWVARDMTGAQAIKILSSSGTESIRDHVFNFDRAQHLSEIVVVEGVFDALRHGPSFVALLGKTPTEQQVAVLLAARQRGVHRVTVLLDRDAPHEARHLAGRLSMHLPDVRLAGLTFSKDPGEATEDEIAEALRTARKPALT